MANSSGYATNGRLSGNIRVDLQKQRQRERHQQIEKDAKQGDQEQPSFAEPIRILQRQDSLANSIQNILGDVSAVQNVIGRDPNMWLGTTRPPPTSRHNSHKNTGERSNDRREGSSSHKTSSLGGQQARSKPLSTHSSQRGKTGNTLSPERSKPRETSLGISLKTRTTDRLPFSENSKISGATGRERQSRLDTAERVRGYSVQASSDGLAFSTGNLSTSVSLLSVGEPSGIAKLSTSHYNKATNQESHQSDEMPGNLEDIFQEMAILNEPLTEIPTPNLGSEFTFSRPNEKTSDTNDGNVTHTEAKSRLADHADNAASDSGSSEESEESDDSDADSVDSEASRNTWILGNVSRVDPGDQGSQKNKKPDKSTNSHAALSGASGKSTASRKSSRSRNSARNTNPVQSAASDSGEVAKPGVRDKEVHEKQTQPNHSRSSQRTRKSSSSNLRSVSPVSRDSSKAVDSYHHHHQAEPPKSKRKEADKESTTHPSKTTTSRKRAKGESPYRRHSPNSKNPRLPTRVTVSQPASSSPPHRHRHGRLPVKRIRLKNSPESSPVVSSSNSSSESSDDESDNFSTSTRPLSAAPTSSEAESDVDPPPVFTRSPEQVSSVPSPRQRFHSSSSVKSQPAKLEYQPQTGIASPDRKKHRNREPASFAMQSSADRGHADRLKGRDSSKTFNSAPNAPRKEPRNPSSSSLRDVPFHQTTSETKSSSSKPTTEKALGNRSSENLFFSLWVRLKDLKSPDSNSGPRVEEWQVNGNAAVDSHDGERSASTGNSKKSGFSRPATNSTGSETEKPFRRAETVQVAQAGSSNDRLPQGSGVKRKSASSTRAPPASPGDCKFKRLREIVSQSDTEESSPSARSSTTARCPSQARDEAWHWDSQTQTQPGAPCQQWTQDVEQTTCNSSKAVFKRKSELCQRTSNSATAGVASIVTEPDSSWPEQERLLKSSDYMREGKRLKHEGDACTDALTGRTKPGEALSRALTYFEAALCFVMNGYMLEQENGNGVDRNESSNSGSSPSSMYHQTINLLDYIRKMRPHDDQEEIAFRRLNISCIRCQALLYLRVYKLKKDAAAKYSELLSEQFKSGNKSSRTPSPWHVAGMVNGQNVVSPVSPAVPGGVPSPYGLSVPGPSPIAGNNCEPVTSSTQVGKITSPATQNSVFPSKMYDIFKHYHGIMSSVALAHDKWDQAETLQADHTDFFRNVDTLSGRTLMLHSSLREMATYNKVVLHQLRERYVKSPRE